MSADAYEMRIEETSRAARVIAGYVAMGLYPPAIVIDAYCTARAAEDAEIERRTQEMYARLAAIPSPCPICKQIPETRHVNGEYLTDCDTGDLTRWVESATDEEEFPMLACTTAAQSVADWNGYAAAYTEAQREVTE